MLPLPQPSFLEPAPVFPCFGSLGTVTLRETVEPTSTLLSQFSSIDLGKPLASVELDIEQKFLGSPTYTGLMRRPVPLQDLPGP